MNFGAGDGTMDGQWDELFVMFGPNDEPHASIEPIYKTTPSEMAYDTGSASNRHEDPALAQIGTQDAFDSSIRDVQGMGSHESGSIGVFDDLVFEGDPSVIADSLVTPTASPKHLALAASAAQVSPGSQRPAAGTAGSESVHGSVTGAASTSDSTGKAKLKRPPVIRGKKDVPPMKSRAQCTKCKRMCQPLQRSDTVLCKSCRKYRRASTADAEQWEPMELPAEYSAFAASKIWDRKIIDAEAAKKQLYEKSMSSVQVSDDDLDLIDDEVIHSFSKGLFAALLEAPAALPPKELDGEEKPRYRERQLQAFVKCAKLMETKDQVSDASARCGLTVEEAVAMHRDGLCLGEITEESIAAMEKYKNKTTRGGVAPKPKTQTKLTMDIDITCTQRIGKIVDAVTQNKRVALMVLEGRKISDLVRCPTHVFKRRYLDFSTNSNKTSKEASRTSKKRGAKLMLEDQQVQTEEGSEYQDFGHDNGAAKEARSTQAGSLNHHQRFAGNTLWDTSLGATEALNPVTYEQFGARQSQVAQRPAGPVINSMSTADAAYQPTAFSTADPGAQSQMPLKGWDEDYQTQLSGYGNATMNQQGSAPTWMSGYQQPREATVCRMKGYHQHRPAYAAAAAPQDVSNHSRKRKPPPSSSTSQANMNGNPSQW